MKADHYYGKIVDDYDAIRMRNPVWEREQAAVAAMVTRGPVLDCPVGTGRFLGIYAGKGLDCVGVDASNEMLAAAKAKHPDADLRHGSILSLPFADKAFGTVVCSRMLNWFEPGDMAQAMAEIRRLAHDIVVSIRIGTPGTAHGNRTHSAADFAAACEGLEIADKRVIATDGGEFAMYKLT